jgi:hypothetical protein
MIQPTNTQPIVNSSLLGGLIGGIAFLAMFALMGILIRKHLKKKETLKEIYIDNPMGPTTSPLKVTSSLRVSSKMHKALTGFKSKSDTVQSIDNNVRHMIASKMPSYEPMNARIIQNNLQPSQAKIINNQSASVVQIKKDIIENDPRQMRYLKVEFRPVLSNNKGVREVNIDIDNNSNSIVKNKNENITQTNFYKEREVFAAQPIRPDKKVNRQDVHNFNKFVNSVDNLNIVKSTKIMEQQLDSFNAYNANVKRVPVRSTIRSIKK